VAWMRMMEPTRSTTTSTPSPAGVTTRSLPLRVLRLARRDSVVLGSSGRGPLGLDGEVDIADYRASSASVAPTTPRTGRRLVGCLRPGLELVISPHKSVAELGVIGRAEDMHEIVDAERDATLEYLDVSSQKEVVGGDVPRPRVATGGLTWATSRHATTRAGDPQVHDHVLIANAVLMRDARGGWKGADTAFLRDHLHAATAVGRMPQPPRRSRSGTGSSPTRARPDGSEDGR